MLTKSLTRRQLSLGGAAALALTACSQAGNADTLQETAMSDKKMSDTDWANLTEAEWQTRLSAQEFNVLRKEGTERPWSSPLNDEKRAGIFVCNGCKLPLFTNEMKFDSGTGWPSFFNAIDGAVETKVDRKLFVARTEYHCARCGGHQGHVFNDGPEPTGLRYCNNGVALEFIEA